MQTVFAAPSSSPLKLSSKVHQSPSGSVPRRKWPRTGQSPAPASPFHHQYRVVNHASASATRQGPVCLSFLPPWPPHSARAMQSAFLEFHINGVNFVCIRLSLASLTRHDAFEICPCSVACPFLLLHILVVYSFYREIVFIV